ncbi:DUF4129 domain-containing protein [Bacillus sinesaloumensis]|uniref:DUF4129 domain-containing protein n=1 Tax=Litchfieldia sinesaloumensis TaxID=1926280 RepID=UPI000988600A|nr:DUF4129 domain-containing protein [Bacillus sinesaloumensis]
MRYSKPLLTSYQYVMEMILLYIVWILLYIHTEILPPILPFLLIAGVGAAVIAFLLSILKSNTPYLFIMLVAPLLALLSSLMGLSFGQSLMIAAIVCYRVIRYFYRSPKLSEAMVLNVSIITGGIVYFAASVQGYIHNDLVLYLLVTQLLFFMIGKMAISVSESSLVLKNIRTKNNSWSVVGLFSGLLIAAFAIAIIFPFVFVRALSFISSLIGTGMYYLSKPFFNAVDDFEAAGKMQGEKVEPLDGLESANNNSFSELAGDANVLFYLSIFGLLILVAILFLLAKKRVVKEVAIVGEGYQYTTTTESASHTASKWSKPKKLTPQAKVRKLIHELELLSAKHGLGRYHHESITEWLGRNHFLEHRLVDLYERVRYGDEELTEQENEACEEIVKQVKMKIKSVKKSK